ncbi:30S ribosomal protein S9 [Candidatus Fermentibacteria bacterium]|nr:30S ribosomal protein S9 [Candidatus Fermentibacteria bacterium]
MTQVRQMSVGRRKLATARVTLVEGSGNFRVNGKPLEQYFPTQSLTMTILKPFKTCECEGKFDAVVSVAGGGVAGQAGAVRLGIARALVSIDPSFRKVLRRDGLLTRDPRMVERKKYGRPGARKRFQFSKR